MILTLILFVISIAVITIAVRTDVHSLSNYVHRAFAFTYFLTTKNNTIL